ncbi:MAG: hypothetical protein ABI471_01725 [Sphingomonas bacterium]
MMVFAFVLDDIVEFRLREMWRSLARATVARPFILWEQRRVQAVTPAGISAMAAASFRKGR